MCLSYDDAIRHCSCGIPAIAGSQKGSDHHFRGLNGKRPCSPRYAKCRSVEFSPKNPLRWRPRRRMPQRSGCYWSCCPDSDLGPHPCQSPRQHFGSCPFSNRKTAWSLVFQGPGRFLCAIPENLLEGSRREGAAFLLLIPHFVDAVRGTLPAACRHIDQMILVSAKGRTANAGRRTKPRLTPGTEYHPTKQQI